MIQNATPYTGELASVPLSAITLRPQIRTRNGLDTDSLHELANSIREHGILQPLVVHRTGADTYDLIAGERRILAAELAGLAEVPVLVRSGHSPDEVTAMQAVENLQRVDLALADKAEGVAKLAAKLGTKKAAALLGKSPSFVSKMIGYGKIPQQIRDAATDGQCEDIEVLLCVAQAGKKAKTPELIARYNHACQRLANGNLSRADARSLLDSMTPAEEPPAAKDTTAPNDGAEDGEDTGSADTNPSKRASGTQTLGADAWILIRDALAFAIEANPNEKAKNLHALLRDWINNEWGL